jgi:hypothetical protein
MTEFWDLGVTLIFHARSKSTYMRSIISEFRLRRLILFFGVATMLPPCTVSAQSCTSTACQVTVKVVLEKLSGSISNPDNKFFKGQDNGASATRFLANLSTLSREASAVADISLTVDRKADVVQFILGAQKLKWDFITAYLGSALEKAWPATKWIGAGSSIVFGTFDSQTGAYGAAFEFCEPSTNREDVLHAQNFIKHMLATYDASAFEVITKRETHGHKCADTMASYLASRVD